MVGVERSLVYETTGFLVTHSGRSFVDFLFGLPIDLVPLYLQSFVICPLLPRLWQVIYDLADEPPPDTLTLTVWRILKST